MKKFFILIFMFICGYGYAATITTTDIIVKDGLWVDVRAYGAVPGNTDSSAAINNALAAISAKGGGVLSFGSGTYTWASAAALSIPANVTIKGNGKSTILYRYSSTPGHFVVANGEYAHIKDMTINGNGAMVPGTYPIGGSAVELNADHTSIEDCYIYKNRFATIGAQDHSYLDILRNTIVTSEDSAIAVVSDTVYAHHIRIIGNIVLNVGTFGISLDSFINKTPDLISSIEISDNVIYVDNTGAIPGFTGRAIDIQNTSHVNVVHNIIQLNDYNALGIRVYTNAVNNNISENIIRFTDVAVNGQGIQIAYGNAGTRTEFNNVYGNIISVITSTPTTTNIGYGIMVDDHSAYIYGNIIDKMNVGVEVLPVNNTANIAYELKDNYITNCNYGVNLAGTRTASTSLLLNNNKVNNSANYDWIIGPQYNITTISQIFPSGTSVLSGTFIDGLVYDVGDQGYDYYTGTQKTIRYTSAISSNHTVTFHTTNTTNVGEKVRVVKAATGAGQLNVGPSLLTFKANQTGFADIIFAGGDWALAGHNIITPYTDGSGALSYLTGTIDMTTATTVTVGNVKVGDRLLVTANGRAAIIGPVTFCTSIHNSANSSATINIGYNLTIAQGCSGLQTIGVGTYLYPTVSALITVTGDGVLALQNFAVYEGTLTVTDLQLSYKFLPN